MKMLELIYFKYTLRCNNNVQHINNLPVIFIVLSQTLSLFSSVKENQVDTFSQGMESANNDARKWPILPFDVSRDFIISNEILV